jgi:hypothetical protein
MAMNLSGFMIMKELAISIGRLIAIYPQEQGI